MSDEKPLEQRTDSSGHITPAKDDAQRAADIDAMVAANRILNHNVGGNDVEPGQYETPSAGNVAAAVAASQGEPPHGSPALAGQIAVPMSDGVTSTQGSTPAATSNSTASTTTVDPPAKTGEAEEDEEDAEAADNLDELDYNEVRKAAAEAGVSAAGKKDEIIARIRAAK